jgi:hypothetical protein
MEPKKEMQLMEPKKEQQLTIEDRYEDSWDLEDLFRGLEQDLRDIPTGYWRVH